MDDLKSISGCTFTLGTGVFSWTSNKHKSDALSTAKAKFDIGFNCNSQAVWMRRIMEDFGEKQELATLIPCENIYVIAMSKNPVYHNRAKHIALKFHYIKDVVEENQVYMVYCITRRSSIVTMSNQG